MATTTVSGTQQADSSQNLGAILRPVMDAVEAGNAAQAASALRSITREGLTPGLPSSWLDLLAQCLERGSYDALTQPFIDQAFIGPTGEFLVIGPYTARRGSGDIMRLSAVAGRLLKYEPLAGLAREIEIMQRTPLRQPVSPLLPMFSIACAGNFGGEQGDAFMVPDGWNWVDSVRGPALNDMTEQGDRFLEQGRQCIQRVFDTDTADLLLSPLDSELSGLMVRHRSYEIHDAGHAAGLGLSFKHNNNLLPGYWYKGVEEWRADGIGFECGAKLLSELDAGYDLASNFCVRFGFDIPRTPGLDAGTEHVACALLMLDGLMREGALVIRRGKLALRDPSYKGLIHALEGQRHTTIELTRRELELENPRGVMRLYGTVSVHPSTVALMEGMVREVCRDIVVPLV
jgi:hypothetical protein